MKRCPNRHITTGANFCTVCGEKLVEINETCAQCGKPMIDAHKFCGECGAKVDDPQLGSS
jgi:predicted amidophosphoribosyltransferase